MNASQMAFEEMEIIDLRSTEINIAETLIQHRAKAYEFISRIRNKLKDRQKYSSLSREIRILETSVYICSARFADPARPRHIDYPLAVFFVRSRLDPTWNWIVCNVILRTWHEYLTKENVPGNCGLLYLKIPGHSQDVKTTIQSFKQLRKYAGWKRAVKGGQYAVEICKNGHNLHCVLLFDVGLTEALVRRYVEGAWNHRTRRSRASKSSRQIDRTRHLESDVALMDFKRALVLCLCKDITSWSAELIDNVLMQTKGVFPIYTFGCLLEPDHGPDYYGNLNRELEKLRLNSKSE